MILAEREAEAIVPVWAASFIRDRTYDLQCFLVRGVDPEHARQTEADSIRAWNDLLVAVADLTDDKRTALEDLQFLHARVAERLERGGVADLSGSVEALVTALLVDQLQMKSDLAIDAIA